MGKIMKRILSFIYPKRCAFCGNVSKLHICDECRENLPIISKSICRRCGCEKELCSCGPVYNSYKECIAPFYYEGPAKKAVYCLKFKKVPENAHILSSYMISSIERYYHSKNFDCVTAVPAHIINKFKRGYNQAEILARYISKAINLPYIKRGLIKTKITKHQKNITMLDRLSNINGAFRKGKFDFTGKRVLLVDDVKTTGATLNECAKVLKNAGAREVYCITFAITKKLKNI
mgnify:CR=1 FL=1